MVEFGSLPQIWTLHLKQFPSQKQKPGALVFQQVSPPLELYLVCVSGESWLAIIIRLAPAAEEWKQKDLKQLPVKPTLMGVRLGPKYL